MLKSIAGAILAVLLLAALVWGGWEVFDAGRRFERDLSPRVKSCECRACRCMPGGNPAGEAAK